MKFIFSSYKKALFIAFIVLFIIPKSLFAQREKPKNLSMYDQQPYHFGFIIGLNQMSYMVDYKENYQYIEHPSSEFLTGDDYNFDSDKSYYVTSLMPNPYYGFTVGVVGNLRLGKYFDLRLIPSLSFGTRRVEYQFTSVTENKPNEFTKDLFSTFMEFPLHIKYRSKRHNNFAAYVIGGGNFKLDLASQKKYKTEEGDIKNIKVKRSDIAAEIGAGIDFYTYYFKFGVEAKMCFGLLNVLDPQGLIYDTSMDGLHNRMFQLSLTFE